MVDGVHRRIRRAMLTRNAVSPKVRGQYRRSLHATRLARDAQDTTPLPLSHVAGADGVGDGGTPPGSAQFPPQMPPGSPDHIPPPLVPLPGPRRRKLAIVIFAAILPVLLLTMVGAYTLRLAGSIGAAATTVHVPSVRTDLLNNQDSIPTIVNPTNTPNAQGTIAPVATVVPRPMDVVLPRFDRKEPFTMLLIGVDSRDGGVGDDNSFAHSDTLILAYVDPVANHVNLMSIPRDLLVQQPNGYGGAKITDVYANGEARKYTRGGVGLVWTTLEQNFGITIDYFAQVDFNGFTKIITEIGGVTIDNPYSLKDDLYPTADYQYTRFYIPAGIVHLNGDEALQYARTRHDDNDYARNGRQQQVILAAREQAVKANLFGKAPRAD